MTDADLAEAAARELKARETHWPRKVEAGELTQAEAEADLAAWRAIASLLRVKEAETDCSWRDLVAALDRAVERIGQAFDGADGLRRALLEARLGAVVAIRRRIRGSAWAQGYFTSEPQRAAA